MVYTVLVLFLMILPVTALTIDLSRLYVAKSQAQKAADAAALAGAYQYAHAMSSQADTKAREFAKRPENGAYEQGVRNTTVTPMYAPFEKNATGKDVQQLNWYRVSILRKEPTFFAGIFGPQFSKIDVVASATALFDTNAEIPIKGTGTYGVAPGPVNLSLFGPDGWYNNGDRYSTKRLSNNPQTANPDYNGFDANIPEADKGYSFSINLEAFRGKAGNNRAYLQIFDPDCYNVNNGIDAVAGTSIDEMRAPGGGSGTAANATITKYKLWMDPDGSGPLGETPVYGGEQTYGNTSATDMLWNDFFSADMSQIPVGAKIRLQVISTGGSSENGFDLRIDNKPVASKATQDADRAKIATAMQSNPNLTQAQQEALKNPANQFDSLNGSTITAKGHIPINFNQDGTVNMSLGNIPKTAAGGIVTVTNFDTDVRAASAANTIYFNCDPPIAGQPFAGVLSPNGEWRETKITLPSNYQGGNWTASYSAGAQDTSVWDMAYDKPGGDPSGNIRLVK